MSAGFFPESTSLGRYKVVKRLGGGETSEVLLAISHGPHGFERVVVLKRLLPRYQWDTSMGRRLATEAEAYARLTHPAIVRLYDFFEHGGEAVLVVEYVDGPSLRDLIAMTRERRETLSDPIALYVASRVFDALAAAHAARHPRSGEFAPVIHRDVSPGSVLLPWDGFVKLGDFGFAKVKGLAGETSDTRRGVLKGTVGYMAPEQVIGDPVSARTDVYAGCLLLRELLLSAPAFTPGAPELEALRAMAEAQLAPIESLRGGLSPALVLALRRGTARDPEARTLTAAEMVTILRQEADLARAQVSLQATLARYRPAESRASTPPEGMLASGAPSSGTMRFERMHLPPEALRSSTSLPSAGESDSYPTLRVDTPNAIMLPGARDRTTAPPAAPRPARVRGRVLVTMGLAGIAVCAAIALWPNEATSRREAHLPLGPTASVVRTPPVASTEPPQRPPVTLAAAAPVSTPTPTSTIGELVTPAEAHAHRVFVDGHCAADHSGEAIALTCGAHTVRVGSKGREQKVEVPCGGSVAVGAR